MSHAVGVLGPGATAQPGRTRLATIGGREVLVTGRMGFVHAWSPVGVQIHDVSGKDRVADGVSGAVEPSPTAAR